MRLGTVIGRITLTLKEPVFQGGTLLLVQPWTRAQFAGAAVPPLPAGSTVVVYDELGAGQGGVIGFTEGAEASQPFPGDAPVDAYCACLVHAVDYRPPAPA
ncbi:MAG TPA: EutN/CcmL family microcompartment protein [Lacunisphaera sp.]|nr:EutN/CcmL family microcompartment protein [Lacunisphaera sp.]